MNGGLNQIAPRGLRNRIEHRAKDMSAADRKAALSVLEKDLLAFYWGSVDNAFAAWSEARQLTTLTLQERPVPQWLEKRAAELAYAAQITPLLPRLVDLLTQCGVPMNHIDTPLPLKRKSDNLLPYLARCAVCDIPQRFLYTRFARMYRASKGTDVNETPYRALLSQLYADDGAFLAKPARTTLSPDYAHLLDSKEMLAAFMKTAVLPQFGGNFPSHSQLKKHWTPATGQPSTAMLYKAVVKLYGTWRALADQHELPTAYLRDRIPSKEDTVLRYQMLEPRFGRLPTQTEIQAADGALYGHIRHHFRGLRGLYKSLGIRKRRACVCDDGQTADSYAEALLYNALLREKARSGSALREVELHAIVDRCGRASEIDMLVNGWLVIEVEMVDSTRPDLEKKPMYVPKQAAKIADLVKSGHRVLRVQQYQVLDAYRSDTVAEILAMLAGEPPGPFNRAVTIAHIGTAPNKPLGYWTDAQIASDLRAAANEKGLISLAQVSTDQQFRGLRDAFSSLDKRVQSRLLAKAGVRLSSPNWFHPAAPGSAGSGQLLSRIGRACLIRTLRATRGILPSRLAWPDEYSVGLPMALTKQFGSLRTLAVAVDLAWMENGFAVVRAARTEAINNEPGETSLQRAVNRATKLGWRFGMDEWKKLRKVLDAHARGAVLAQVLNPWQYADGRLLPQACNQLSELFKKNQGIYPVRNAWSAVGMDALRTLIQDSELGPEAFCKAVGVVRVRTGQTPTTWNPPEQWPPLGVQRRVKH